MAEAISLPDTFYPLPFFVFLSLTFLSLPVAT
jgi:hypothetical protein